MCGIAGIIRSDGAPVSEEQVARLRAVSMAMAHRGPDDHGLLVSPSGVAALAHRRLSIIDPTPEGHQPMVGRNGAVLVFNGEIYNYRELAQAYHLHVPPSDTAVLLALLELRGISILGELRGFFTFAWWNDSSRELIIARDAFGKKPLYYGALREHFVFASELRGLIASGLVPFRLSADGLSSYLRYYCVPHPLSMVEGVRTLEPGTILRFHDGTATVERWYRLPVHQPRSIGYADAVRETRLILERSVRDRLVSDVPVGAFLSGGLDSNAITALAAREMSQPIETFSVGFESRDVKSEAPWALMGASAYGARHHERMLHDSDVAELLPAFFESMDSPTGDGLNAFLVANAARECSPTLKVVLSGVGGDEAFLGYKKYRWLARREGLVRVARMFPNEIRSSVSEMLLGSHHSPLRAIMRTILEPEAARCLFSRNEIRSLTNISIPKLESGTPPSVSGRVRQDIEHYLPDMLLHDLDSMTMSQSLEARAPLLDRELMEFTWQLPMAIKTHGTTKQLLADAVRDLVPEAILTKPKTGFELPMKEWLMNGSMRSELDLLTSNDLHVVRDGILSRAAVQRVHSEFLRGHSHYLKPWTLIALERWYRCMLKLQRGASAAALKPDALTT